MLITQYRFLKINGLNKKRYDIDAAFTTAQLSRPNVHNLFYRETLKPDFFTKFSPQGINPILAPVHMSARKQTFAILSFQYQNGAVLILYDSSLCHFEKFVCHDNKNLCLHHFIPNCHMMNP